MKTLKISEEISFPLDAVTQTLAAIGRKGAGKTYLASMLAEQMLDVKAQVVVIDPVGNWWGLRVDADGKHKGKEIFVIGGEHGDVPLVPEAGKRIAQLIVEKGISAVVDVSGFRMGEHKRFAADFAEEFFHLKKGNHSPVHVFIEEAQTLIPQRVGPDEARMVGAFERIVRLGRNYGIGCTLITQRPQSVNKEVLSQVECLCVLQVTGLHERKALEGWVQEAGADRKLIGELPSLGRGEGYVWSPSWLKIYKRVNFSKKQTFDASATPEVGKATQAASLSAVDVEMLKKDMADVVEKAAQDDPKLLKAEIAKLKREATKVVSQAPQVIPKQEKVRERRVDIFILKDAQIERLEKIVSTITEALKKARQPAPLFVAKEHLAPKMIARPASVVHVQDDGRESNLSKGARLVLTYLHGVYPHWKSKAQLWIATGYAPGGGFNNIIYELTGSGLIEKDGSGKYAAMVGAPIQRLIEPNFDPSLDKWDAKLSLGARKVFRLLLNDSDISFSKDVLAQETGYALGGGFNNIIYELTGKELAIKIGTSYQINPEALDL